ncbi:prepilin peptidase [Microbacterium sp.]|uniref:prepilin peptidase n=1 Tax=Microbacterium sp. TaxID=51671 RepID=UPI0039E50A27
MTSPTTLSTLIPVITAIGGVFGLLIGSFLNVVIWRVPQGMSIVHPPSACPQCGTRIAWYDNIPVLSYLVLLGRCRHCSAHISVRYPLVEFATGVFFAVLTFGALADWWPLEVLPALLYLAAISVALFLIDLDTRRLPDVIVLSSYFVCGALLVLASVLLGDGGALLQAAIGGVALFMFYLIMAMIYPGGMGGGDVKLAGLLGMCLGWFGWGALIVGAFAAFVIGGVVGVVLMIGRRATRKTAIPFGPSMLVGAWLGIFAGSAIADFYLTTVGLA